MYFQNNKTRQKDDIPDFKENAGNYIQQMSKLGTTLNILAQAHRTAGLPHSHPSADPNKNLFMKIFSN